MIQPPSADTRAKSPKPATKEQIQAWGQAVDDVRTGRVGAFYFGIASDWPGGNPISISRANFAPAQPVQDEK